MVLNENLLARRVKPYFRTRCTLNAVGGAPMIDAPDFIPVYPFILPLTNVSVDVRRFDQSAIRNFMLVESITNLKKSITGAYEYVLSLLEALWDGGGIILGGGGIWPGGRRMARPWRVRGASAFRPGVPSKGHRRVAKLGHG